MSLYDEQDWIDSEHVELTAGERSGTVRLPGIVSFVDCVVPGQVEEFEPRYQISVKVPKGNEAMATLFAVCDQIINKTWKDNAQEVGENVWSCLDGGVNPRQASIPMQDGDLYSPEYNAGYWWIKPTRRVDAGRPTIMDADGALIYEPNGIDGEGNLVLGELIGDDTQNPKQNDIVQVLIRVWGQAKRDRLNFTFEGVRLIKRGAPNQRVIENQKATESLLGGYVDASSMLNAGSVDVDADSITTPPAKRTPAKKGAKKASAKKGAKKASAKKGAKRAGSVFRKGR